MACGCCRDRLEPPRAARPGAAAGGRCRWPAATPPCPTGSPTSWCPRRWRPSWARQAFREILRETPPVRDAGAAAAAGRRRRADRRRQRLALAATGSSWSSTARSSTPSPCPAARSGSSPACCEVMANEAQLATVLGHEVGHVNARHARPADRGRERRGAGPAAAAPRSWPSATADPAAAGRGAGRQPRRRRPDPPVRPRPGAAGRRARPALHGARRLRPRAIGRVLAADAGAGARQPACPPSCRPTRRASAGSRGWSGCCRWRQLTRPPPGRRGQPTFSMAATDGTPSRFRMNSM